MNEKISIKDYNELEGECAPVFYKEIERFFAKGMLVLVDKQLNVIDVALAVQNDKSKKIQKWIKEELLVRVHDEYAIKWSQSNERLMAITVVPWVLVQEISD